MAVVFFELGLEALGQLHKLTGILDRFLVIVPEDLVLLQLAVGQPHLGVVGRRLIGPVVPSCLRGGNQPQRDCKHE